MKQNIDIEKKAFGPNGQTIKKAKAGFEKNHALVLLLLTNCSTNVANLPVLWMDKDCQQLGRDGPPGRARSPGRARGHPPANRGKPHDGLISYNNKFQNFNTYQNSNFYKHFKFFIMKKQILFLMVFLLAAFAGVNKSYGQCVEGPLSPIAGKEYTYSVAISGTTFTGTPGKYIWFVTSNPSLITGGVLNTAAAIPASSTTIIVGTGYSYITEATGQMDIKLTWSAEAIAAALATIPTKYYLVVHNVEANAVASPSCDAMNIKAWEIIPINLFNITIENTIADGTVTATINSCVSAVQSAVITPVAAPGPSTITYDYGENALYFKLTAYNFTSSWTPTIGFAGLSAGQTITSAVWSRTSDFTGATALTVTGTSATGSIAALDAKTDDGEAVFVKFVVDHSTFENLNASNIVITVNGKDAANNDDVNPADCVVSSTDDVVTQTIMARPTVTPTPTPFILP